MEINLTKDADKAICLIYKEYLARRESGASKKTAKDFSSRDQWPESFPKDAGLPDFLESLNELKSKVFVKRCVLGGFQLEDEGIIYMEQRFPGGISQILDWLGKIKSAIPFA